MFTFHFFKFPFTNIRGSGHEKPISKDVYIQEAQIESFLNIILNKVTRLPDRELTIIDPSVYQMILKFDSSSMYILVNFIMSILVLLCGNH